MDNKLLQALEILNMQNGDPVTVSRLPINVVEAATYAEAGWMESVFDGFSMNYRVRITDEGRKHLETLRLTAAETELVEPKPEGKSETVADSDSPLTIAPVIGERVAVVVYATFEVGAAVKVMDVLLKDGWALDNTTAMNYSIVAIFIRNPGTDSDPGIKTTAAPTTTIIREVKADTPPLLTESQIMDFIDNARFGWGNY